MVLLKRCNLLIHSNNLLCRLSTSDNFIISIMFLIFKALYHSKCISNQMCISNQICISIALRWFSMPPCSISVQTILLLLWCIFFFFILSSRCCTSSSFSLIEIILSMIFEALGTNSTFSLTLGLFFSSNYSFIVLNIVDSLKTHSH